MTGSNRCSYRVLYFILDHQSCIKVDVCLLIRHPGIQLILVLSLLFMGYHFCSVSGNCNKKTHTYKPKFSLTIPFPGFHLICRNQISLFDLFTCSWTTLLQLPHKPFPVSPVGWVWCPWSCWKSWTCCKFSRFTISSQNLSLPFYLFPSFTRNPHSLIRCCVSRFPHFINLP